ncbi:hypothetical protein BH09PSE4_BH09PSE4_16100 [soil metagenome]
MGYLGSKVGIASIALICLAGPATAQTAPAPPPAVTKIVLLDSEDTRLAHIVGQPTDWFTSDDYPADAIAANVQGKAVIRVDVGADGSALSCSVVTSSGSASLDSKTCDIALARGHFAAGKDDKGKSVAGSVPFGIKWVLPEIPSFDVSKGAVVITEPTVQIHADAGGIVRSCQVLSQSTPGPDLCSTAPIGKYIGMQATSGGKSVAFKVTLKKSFSVEAEVAP